MARSLLYNIFIAMIHPIVDTRVAPENSGITVFVGPTTRTSSDKHGRRAGFGIQTQWASSMD